MKKLLLLGLVGLVLLLVGACAKAAPAPTPVVREVVKEKEVVKEVPKEVIRWKYVITTRLVHEAELHQQWAKLVEERTKGRLKIDIVSLPEVGLTGFEMVKVIRGGVLDVADVLPVYIGGDIPLIEGFELPGIYSDLEVAAKADKIWIETFVGEVEKKTDARLLFWHYWHPQVICSKKPIRSWADAKGMKIRTYSLSGADFMKALGLEPVSIPYAEVYTAMERGTIDAVYTSAIGCDGIKIYEIAKYVLKTNGGAGMALPTNMVMVSNKSWAKLPPDLQEALLQVAKETKVKFDEWSRYIWLESYNVLKKKGMEVVESTPEMDRAIREAAVNHVIPAWFKRVGPEGQSKFNDVLGPIIGYTVAR